MNLNLKQYKALDLVVFAMLIAVFEAINILAISQWFVGELFTISLLIPLCAIVMMRWNAFGIVHAAISGLAYCLAISGTVDVTWQQYLIYVVGNCFGGVALFMFLAKDKQKIVENTWFTILYVVVIFLFVEVGRTLVAVVLGNGIEIFVEFAAKDSLSATIGLVIVLIARKQNGLFEDQIHYLKRLEAERQEQRKLKDDGMQ